MRGGGRKSFDKISLRELACQVEFNSCDFAKRFELTTTIGTYALQNSYLIFQ